MVSSIIRIRHFPQLVQNIKLCELATGLGTGFVRPPRLPLEGNEFKRVQNIIKGD